MKNVLVVLLLLLTVSCAATLVPSLDEERQALRLIDDGTIYLRERELDQAEAAFRLAFDLAGLAQALNGLGCVEFLRGNDFEAERYFLQAIARDAGYSNVYANLALLYERQGDLVRARSLYDRALYQDPLNFRGRNNLSAMLFDADDRQLATNELLKAKAAAQHHVIVENLKLVDSDRNLD